jgi:hypothetical protein
MTPFEEFRLWLRQGRPIERGLAAIAGLLVLALVAWALVPSGNSPSGGNLSVGGTGSQSGTGPVAAPGGGGGSAGSVPGTGNSPSGTGSGSGTGPAASGSPSGSANQSSSVVATGGPSTGPGTGATSPTPGGTVPTNVPGGHGPSGGSACASSGDQGVTSSTISMGVVILNVSGGNAILGVPSPSEQQVENQAVIDGINNSGGVDCRKIVPKYYTDNPLDSNSEHSICLQIVSAKVFAVIGGLYQPQNATCLPQNHLPTYTQTQRPSSQMKQFYPYYFSFYDDSATDFQTYVAGAKQYGFFNGLTKLGVVTLDCFPEENTQLLQSLARAGIPSNKIETFDYGCPPGGIVEPPNTVAAAVLKFHGDGVNRVMSSGANMASFSSQANSQGYHPQYAVSDIDTTMTLSPSTGFQPDPQNFDGALDVSNSQYGATTTPGVAVSPLTAQCDGWLVKGHAQLKAEQGDGYAGGVCDQWNMFVLGATHAPSLQRSALAGGLDSVGYYYQSYPGAPALWNQPGKTWAGPYWRPLRYNKSCTCWKIINASFSSAEI